MKPLRLVPSKTTIDFLGKKWGAFVLSMTLLAGSAFLLATQKLNFGIDFTGGIVIEVRGDDPIDLADIRSPLSSAIPGEVSLQHFGSEYDIMIRIGLAADAVESQSAIVEEVKTALAENLSTSLDYRKSEFVGPQVGSELIQAGALALGLAFLAIMAYIWLRFEWQFGLGAIVALLHDTFLTLGLFSLMQIEFNLTSIAAILTIIGYSINDSVVIFDRIRENLRKYKKMPLPELLNISINDNLSRTIMTSGTTMVALIALVWLGGEVIKGFSIAVLFGVAVGTYSSIYIAAPLLIYMKIRHSKEAQDVS